DGSPSADPARGGGGGSGIAWPVSGGTWHIVQGYNGGTHQNRSASAQYYYSLDIASVDGNTAGQPVLSPVSGTVRWVHPASGGIAIDMGNGYILAMFHCTFAGSLGSGQTVQQGQYLGTVSGPGGNGYAGTPHIDMTLWRSSDGGSTRSSSPFSGANAVSGMSFPDVGGWNQHYGIQFNP
ncbi:MAG TPA: peptidoglycan DD-metalloendopeptidase family protein, partial [Thermomicrobiales bacterium]|nr:peptidoglycan DD-metalloendopeptidase family protein [Thermomicrobiales bacterium]